MEPHTLSTREEIRQLIVNLNDGPCEGTRFLLQGILRNVLREILTCEVILDNWPDFTAVVLKPSKQTKEIVGSFVVIFGTVESNLEKLIRYPGVIPWHENFVIRALPAQFKELFERIAPRSHSKIEIIDNEEFIVTKFMSTNSEMPKLPDGYRVSSLTSEDAPAVNQKWEYGGTPQMERRIRLQIKHMPTVGIYDKKGELVSFGLGQYDNTTGMGVTVPEHRGLRLGSIVHAILFTKVWQMNNSPPFGFVRESNDVMFRMLAKLGVEKLPDHVLMIRCSPVLHTSKI